MAETPPPFQVAPQPAPTKSSGSKACLVAVIMVMGLCIVFAIVAANFMKGMWGQVTSTASCFGMFEVASKATHAYAKEHGGKFPNAATWQDDIKPYYTRLYNKFKSEEMPANMLPPAPGQMLQCVWDGRKTGIAFNIELSEKLVDKIQKPGETPMLFEVDTVGTNLAMKYDPKPKSKAPKLMYNDRDWLVYYVEGERDPFTSGNTGSKSFKVTVDDALESDESTGKSAPDTGNNPSGETGK